MKSPGIDFLYITVSAFKSSKKLQKRPQRDFLHHANFWEPYGSDLSRSNIGVSDVWIKDIIKDIICAVKLYLGLKIFLTLSNQNKALTSSDMGSSTTTLA